MSKNYLVLARKYRPSSFIDLKGQEFLVTTIVNSIKLDRIAHTFLLTGIRGGGKTTTARIIAKTLNCTSPIIDEKLVTPCGECDNCQAAISATHPDIIELDAASRTGVNDVREIIENTSYLPLLGKYKIYIIDEVHMLSNSAFNALLKTLEEPPEHVKFIFATTELRKVPITILSRCQKFELKRLTSEQLVDHLKDILNKEKILADDDALHLIALHAEGSVRDSLSLLDLIISNANNNKITKEQVKDLLGYSNNSRVIDLLSATISGEAQKTTELIKGSYYEGKDLVYMFQQMMELVHNITKLKLNIDIPSFEYSEEEITNLESLANNISIASLTILWQMLLKGLQEIQASHNQLIASEMLLIRLCYLSEIPTPEDLINSIESSEPIKAPIKTKESISRPKLAINDFEELVQLFHQNREMLLYQYLLNDVHLIDFEPLKVTIRHTNSVPPNFAKKVASFLQEWTGDKWNIILSTDNGTPTLSSQAEDAKAKERDKFLENDMVKEVLKNFSNAQIKNVTKN